MIYYIASQTYQQVVTQAITESDVTLIGGECKSDFFFLKWVKESGNILNTLDCLIVDISALEDTDEEMLSAVEIIRMLHDNMRVIVLAANRGDQDELLTKFFQMSIYDLINTDDFLEIKEGLIYSITTGMQYKDAVKFKECADGEKKVIKTEIKQTVNKILIGIAGSEKRIGVTHNSIILANYLRKRGFMVALAEYGKGRGVFNSICAAFEERLFDNAYFSMNGVDFYSEVDDTGLGSILGKSYNFVIVDFGKFADCDQVTFNKCHVRLVITGSKPWECESIYSIFQSMPEDTLKLYHFCFNFTEKKLRTDVQKGMSVLQNIHFLNILEDPFSAYEFADAENILAQYMPLKTQNEKRRLFGRKDKR